MRQIEVFADIACPFAYVGIRSFVEQRQERGLTEPRLHVRSWPLELVNATPHPAEHLASEIAALRAEVAPHLFSGVDLDHFPASTLPALAAEVAAHAKGPAHGEAFSLAVRDALWEHGLDISDSEVLHRLCDDLGVEVRHVDDAAVVDAEWTEGRQRGVAGSPHFFTDHGDFFCPMLDISQPDGEMKVTFDQDGLRRLFG